MKQPNTITFLGTGTSTGVPMIGCNCSLCRSTDPKDKRLRSSAYIEYEGFKILIDCGPDFRQQALTNNITDIDAILLTHQHKDHTGGLDDVRAFNYFAKKATPIYCEKGVLEDGLKHEYYYVFNTPSYPGIPKFDIHIIENKPFFLEKEIVTPEGKKEKKRIEIVPVRVFHYKLPVLAFRIGSLCYLTDASYIPQEEMVKLKNLDIFTINAINRTHHISHFTLQQALEAIKQVGAKRSYLTHLSHQMGQDENKIDGRHKALSKELPRGVYVAYDGLKLTF